MLIALAGAEGVALLAAPAAAAAGFLAETVRLVPPGQEHDRIDWDRGLQDLLTA
ncbi:hypothetical protein [Kitasatospora sp. NPDC094011]|uniref:hypothetical protein n=1 Tax=Kitasatospora sp. NPDC094011 TaxID=3364090 RepID=UPI00382E6B58